MEKKVVKRGKESILEKRNTLTIYLKNKEDAEKYSYASNKLIKTICPNCGYEKEMRINDLYYQGFGCSICSDGVSFGEKILSSILNQVGYNGKFIREKSFDWSSGRRYDFYIPSLNLIIEIHGMQHYKETKIGRGKGRTYIEEQENDRIKYNLAKENGINNYVVLDCRYSRLEYIKKSIENSANFNKYFNTALVNWEKALEYVNKSYIKRASEMYSDGDKIQKISNSLNVNRCTVREWLKLGNQLGFCNYQPVTLKNKVSDVDYDKILMDYNIGLTIKQISNKFNIHEDTVRKFIKKCSKEKKCKYEGDYNKKNARSRKIENTYEKRVYNSMSEASRLKNIPLTTLRRLCNDKLNKEWVIL